MNHYKSLSEVKAHFKRLQQEEVIKSSSREFSLNAHDTNAEIGARDGISAEVTGTHLYLKLDLSIRFTTSSDNEQRKRVINLLARLVHGFRKILEEKSGEVLEVQGGMLHGFIPSALGDTSLANEALSKMMIFVKEEIQPKAGNEYRKCTAAFSYGQTIFVVAPGSHEDLSIVSLSNSANVPAKILYLRAKELRDKEIVEVDLSENYRESDTLTEQVAAIFNSEVRAMAASLPAINEGRVSVANRASPLIEKAGQASPLVEKKHDLGSPTVEEPSAVFAFCFRADIDGFTQMVADGFLGTEERRQFLAQQFYDVMRRCKEFCDQLDLDVVQMPWAGDSFNLLIVTKELDSYNELRRERILKISAEFEDFLKSQFFDLKWSFATAGGEVDTRQVCNTLVSRISFPSESNLKSHMITAGRPVQRALDGQIDGGVDGSEGTLWREDKDALNERYQEVVHCRSDVPNHHKYDVDDVRQLTEFAPTPKAYEAPAILTGSKIVTPSVMPHYPVKLPKDQ